jgi:IS4 transposase
LKSSAVYKRVQKREVKEGGNVVSDYEIIIPSLSKGIRLRKIIARDPETKKKVVLLTNNPNWSSATVAAVYKDRWQIELFFKAIKQNLKIKRFYGNSKNAVMTQIWISLIAYLFVVLSEAVRRFLQITVAVTEFSGKAAGYASRGRIPLFVVWASRWAGGLRIIAAERRVLE